MDKDPRFDACIELAHSLRSQLERALESADVAPEHIRALDAASLFEWAAERASFRHQVAHLERDIVVSFTEACRSMGLADADLEAAANVRPREASAFRQVLEQIAHLQHELSAKDQMLERLLDRARACVDGYLAAVMPKTSAYDRRGQRAYGPVSASTVSHRV